MEVAFWSYHSAGDQQVPGSMRVEALFLPNHAANCNRMFIFFAAIRSLLLQVSTILLNRGVLKELTLLF